VLLLPTVKLMKNEPVRPNHKTPEHCPVVACCEANEHWIASLPTCFLPCQRVSVEPTYVGDGMVLLVFTVLTLIT
jgi:hypothetical protein